MLQFLNRLSGSFAVRGLFAVLLFAFVIFGVGDVLRMHGGGDNTVASVGDQKITTDQLDHAFQEQLASLGRKMGGRIDPAMAKQIGFLGHVLDALIDNDVQEMAAHDDGFIISDRQASQEIQKIPAFQEPTTKKFDKDLFTRTLAANQYKIDDFVKFLKQQMASKLLTDSELGGAVAPHTLTDALYRYQYESRRGEILRLNRGTIVVPAPTQEQLQQYYDQHKDSFTAPEYRSFSFLLLTVGDVAKTITISPDELKQAYEAHIAEFQVPERRDLKQVLVSDETKAQQIATAARSGKSLADAAKASGAKMDDLGLMAKKDLPEPLQDPVFAAAAGTILLPVKTGFGWHVVAVGKSEAAHQLPFDQAKAALEGDLRAEKAQDKLAEMDKKIDDQLAGGAKLSEVASQFSVPVINVTSVDATGKHPDGSDAGEVKDHLDIVKAVFSATADTGAQMHDTRDGGAFAFELGTIIPPALRPLDTVRTTLVAAYNTEARDKAAMAKATQLADKAKAGASFGSLSKEANAIVMPIGPFTRDAHDAAPGAAVIAALFKLQNNGDVSIVQDQDGPVLVRLSEIVPASIKSPADVAPLAKTTATAIDNDLESEYQQSLRQEYSVKINDKVLDSMRTAN